MAVQDAVLGLSFPGRNKITCGALPAFFVSTARRPEKQRIWLFVRNKEMYGRIWKSLNIVALHRGMSKLKLKINVNLPQLVCIVFSVTLNGDFVGFAFTVTPTQPNPNPNPNCKYFFC